MQKAWGQWKEPPAGGVAAAFLLGDAPGGPGAYATGGTDPCGVAAEGRAKAEEIRVVEVRPERGRPAENRGERGTGETAHASRVSPLPAFGQV